MEGGFRLGPKKMEAWLAVVQGNPTTAPMNEDCVSSQTSPGTS